MSCADRRRLQRRRRRQIEPTIGETRKPPVCRRWSANGQPSRAATRQDETEACAGNNKVAVPFQIAAGDWRASAHAAASRQTLRRRRLGAQTIYLCARILTLAAGLAPPKIGRVRIFDTAHWPPLYGRGRVGRLARTTSRQDADAHLRKTRSHPASVAVLAGFGSFARLRLAGQPTERPTDRAAVSRRSERLRRAPSSGGGGGRSSSSRCGATHEPRTANGSFNAR